MSYLEEVKARVGAQKAAEEAAEIVSSEIGFTTGCVMFGRDRLREKIAGAIGRASQDVPELVERIEIATEILERAIEDVGRGDISVALLRLAGVSAVLQRPEPPAPSSCGKVHRDPVLLTPKPCDCKGGSNAKG